MRRPLVLLVVAAAMFAGSAVADVPPPVYTGIAATNAQPVAGHTFTGVTVTNNNGQKINYVTCTAKVGHKTLHSQVLRYFNALVNRHVGGPNAVTCSWAIPTGAAGRTLRVIVNVATSGLVADSSANWTVR